MTNASVDLLVDAHNLLVRISEKYSYHNAVRASVEWPANLGTTQSVADQIVDSIEEDVS